MLLHPAQQTFLLNVARAAITHALRRIPCPTPSTIDPILAQPAGCFVSLHQAATHALRGCIGRIQSPDSLVIAVHQSAQGVIADPRFTNNPVTLAELPALTLEISVLSPLMLAAHTLDFNPHEHGIFLEYLGRTGTFLPQVAKETGWSREQLLSRLCSEKMGLPAETWKDPQAKLFRYTAGVIGPVAFVAQGASISGMPEEPARVGGFAGGGNRFTI